MFKMETFKPLKDKQFFKADEFENSKDAVAEPEEVLSKDEVSSYLDAVNGIKSMF
jgi:hypothetical protein